jgi:hypothetical protein
VNHLAPTSHVRLATVQILAPTTLAKVEGILPEDTSPINDPMARLSATCAHDNPSVASIRAMVPEKHTSMTAALKHLKPHQVPPSTNLSPGRSAAPSMQAIIVYCVSIVKPQLAPIIGVDLEVVTACPEDSKSACPTHSKVIASGETWPPGTCVTVVHCMAPTSHLRSASVQILASTPLPKVESVFHEEAMAISCAVAFLAHTTRTGNNPSVSSVRTMVPEEHPRMTTTLKHFQSHNTPSSTHMPSGCAATPSMQAVVVDCVPIVDPQLTPIIGYELEVVMARPENSHATSPTHSEVIATRKTRPFTTCVAVVHHVAPSSHVWPASLQIGAPTTLTKVVDVFPKEASPISCTMISTPSASCTHNNPPVCSVVAMVPEEHPSMTTTLKHLKSHQMPSSTNMPSSRSTAPSVQAIIVDCVPIVDPQLAAIIGYELKVVMACSEDSHAASPTHSEVIATREAIPFGTSVAIIHNMAPASHVWPATIQVLAPTTLTKVENVLPKEASTISGTVARLSLTTCTHNNPSVASVGPVIPEAHTSMTAAFKHLKSHQVPPSTNLSLGSSATPTVQAIVVNCVSVVEPQLAPIIRVDLEVVTA